MVADADCRRRLAHELLDLGRWSRAHVRLDPDRGSRFDPDRWGPASEKVADVDRWGLAPERVADADRWRDVDRWGLAPEWDADLGRWSRTHELVSNPDR